MHAETVLTLIANGTTLPDIAAFVSPGDAQHIVHHTPLNAAQTAMDVYFAVPPVAVDALYQRAAALQVDAVIQPVADREKRLLISDMDSTMIEQECIDELADKAGIKPQVAAITERAMQGELEFESALRARVALLKGLPESVLEDVFVHHLTVMPGAATLVATMKARGASAHLVSGGFTFFTARIARQLGFDTHEANQLIVHEGVLSGQVTHPILNKDSKLESLHAHAKSRAVKLSQTMAVGDGANDLPMLLAAGLGVAYHAKPVVAEQAAASIRFNDLTALLYLQGIAQHAWVIT